MDRVLIQRKIFQAERALNRVKEHLPQKLARFQRDFDAQDIVYRNFQIVVQNCADIGSHIISDRDWEIPRTMGEHFDILVSRKVIPSGLARQLRNMCVLRNIIVHDYARLNLKKAFPLLRSAIILIPRFCRYVSKLR